MILALISETTSTVEFSAVYMTSTVAAPRPRASCTALSALLSERIVVAMDQYAALSAAVETRWPVEMRFCVTSIFLFVAVNVCSAVIAAELVRRLDMVMSLSMVD